MQVADGGIDDASDAAIEAEAAAAGCPTDGGIPGDLSCTGLYSDWASKTISPDVMAYTPGLVFWSDGAQKSRWIYLPPGSQIDDSDMDNWVFPVGTKIWKTFEVGGQTIETRLLWKTSTGWVFLDYRWSADGQSAPELDFGETNVDGTTYEVPPTSACPRCHGGRPDNVLGFDFLGLGVPGGAGVTLASLADAGRLTQAPPATSVAIPEDATQKAAKALAWLHVNCGDACHNGTPNAEANGTGLFMRLLANQLYPSDGGVARVSDLDTYRTTVGVRATAMPNGVAWERIVPGASGQSLLPLMASVRDPDAGDFTQMPPLVSHVPDALGVKLVNDWIDALGDAGPGEGGDAGPDGGDAGGD